MADEENKAMVVSADGAQLLTVNTVGVKDGRLCINGALMGAWPTDMFMDVEGVKAVIKSCDIPALAQYFVTQVLGGTIKKL